VENIARFKYFISYIKYETPDFRQFLALLFLSYFRAGKSLRFKTKKIML